MAIYNDELYNLFAKLQLKKFIESMNLKANENKIVSTFDDSKIEIEDLEKLELKDIKEHRADYCYVSVEDTEAIIEFLEQLKEIADKEV